MSVRVSGTAVPSGQQKEDHCPAAGARLGPYEVLARIGAGGMGEVYRGRWTN